MATHKDAMKRQRQNVKRNARNRYYIKGMRFLNKEFYAALESGNEAEASSLLNRNVKHIQRIAGKGIIHKNQSDRRCSRLHKAFNKAFANA
jgi:small subunit ribosomal protein S20